MRRHGLLALLALSVAFAGCAKPDASTEVAAEHGEEHHDEHGAEEAGHVELTPEAAKAAGIVVRPVTMAPFQGVVEAPGVVATAPEGHAKVTPPFGGRIVRLLVSVGDPVRRGQPLAVLESAELADRASAITEARRDLLTAEAEVARERSEVGLAESKARAAGTTLRRQREFARSGAFSQPGRQAAERELNDARAALESAQKEAVVHQAQLERSERLFRQELVSRVEVENARLDVEKDRIAQERAEREIAIARTAFERESTVARRGLANAREVQGAEADLRTTRLEAARAVAALAATRAGVAGARLALSRAQAAYAALAGAGNRASGGTLTLVAPIDGRIAHREATVGQAVEHTAELFEIDDLRTVLVVVPLPESAIASSRPGASISVVTDTYPGRTFAGTVATIGGRIDPKTRTLPLTGHVPNPDGALRPEMFVRVALSRGANVSALAVPNGALFTEDDASFVFVETKAGAYERRKVARGRTAGENVEIVGGLEPGARVVTAGVFTLRSQAQKDELKGHED